MKKKRKMILKVNNNKTAKLYLNKKWQRDVAELDIHFEPFEIERLAIPLALADG